MNTLKLLPIALLAALAACGNPETGPAAAEKAKAKAASDGTLAGDVAAAIIDCGGEEVMKVGASSPTLVLVDLIDKTIATEGAPGNDKFHCVFQGAIKMKDTLAVWNQKNIVVNRGKLP